MTSGILVSDMNPLLNKILTAVIWTKMNVADSIISCVRECTIWIVASAVSRQCLTFGSMM